MKPDWLLCTVATLSPLVWFTAFFIDFALAPLGCRTPWRTAALAVNAIALIVAAGSGMFLWRQWGQTHRSGVALGGVLLSALVVVVLINQSIPDLTLTGCE